MNRPPKKPNLWFSFLLFDYFRLILTFLFPSLQRTYSLFRNLGLRFLPVVNKYNQVVGTITRSDLTADALAETMLQKGKKHKVRYSCVLFMAVDIIR